MTSVRKRDFQFVSVKDTSSMLLLHRRLGGVDGFTDAAQLRGEHMTGMNLGRLACFSTHLQT